MFASDALCCPYRSHSGGEGHHRVWIPQERDPGLGGHHDALIWSEPASPEGDYPVAALPGETHGSAHLQTDGGPRWPQGD